MSAETHSTNITSSVEVKKNNLLELLQWPLVIPEYQRRYCWKQEQVSLLLKDIERLLADKGEPPLFLGTVILHLQDDKANLVDGQQRCLTLVLLLKALRDLTGDAYKAPALISLLQAKFSDSQAQQCLAANYQQIKAYLQNDLDGWHQDQQKLQILLEKMEFVVITISSIDQAFAFFDSQNSAGKRLSDFDLLKARHLRGIVSPPEVGIGCSRIWEDYERLKLNSTHKQYVAYYLTRDLVASTRQRQRNKDIDTLLLEQEFPVSTQTEKQANKRVSANGKALVQLAPHSNSDLLRDWQVQYHAEKNESFPFTFVSELPQPGNWKISHVVDDVSLLPLQLHQALTGGEQFFIFIAKYAELYKQLFGQDVKPEQETAGRDHETDSIQERLLKQHRQLEYRQGEGYPRLIQIWQSLVIFYVDRFGKDENFESFVVLADQYVFSLQMALRPLRRDSIEKIFRTNELFAKLLEIPSSIKTLDLISELLEKQAANKDLKENLEKAQKGWRIYHYIDRFYWQDPPISVSHQQRDNSLSRLLNYHLHNKTTEAGKDATHD